MEKIDPIQRLQQSIDMLVIVQSNDRILLKEQFEIFYAGFNPANLIKNTFKELTSSNDFKEDILDTTIGLATGYLSKKVVLGNTHNPFKQLLGVILQMAVTNLVTNNSETIKLTLKGLIDKFTNKKINPE
jgi:hypothetical protein